MLLHTEVGGGQMTYRQFLNLKNGDAITPNGNLTRTYWNEYFSKDCVYRVEVFKNLELSSRTRTDSFMLQSLSECYKYFSLIKEGDKK
jgi:hypothetical protein